MSGDCGPDAVTVGDGGRCPDYLGYSGLLVVVEGGKEGENWLCVGKMIDVCGL